MSKRANPAAVGGFVLGGLVLLVGGILFFGSTNLFAQTEKYVIYFDGSLNGLRVGAPVKFTGVEIGSVQSVRLIGVVSDGFEAYTETVIEIDGSRFERRGPEMTGTPAQRMRQLAKAGLRARLETESLITGQRYVGIDILPDYEMRMVGKADTAYPEIPAVPTVGEEIEQVARGVLARFEKLPLESIAARLDSTIGGIDALVNDPKLRANLNGTLEEAHATFASFGPGSPVGYQLATALREVSEAARAIRVLADYVEKNPNSLVFGRAGAR